MVVYVSFGVCHALRVTRGQTLQMKYGALRHEFVIGKPFGSQVGDLELITQSSAGMW